MIDLNKHRQQAQSEKKTNKKYFNKLSRRRPVNLDQVVEQLHHEVFEEIDCLQCANCCKTTSPIFRDKDIERIAQHLGVKPSFLVENYLHIDEDGDYVLNSSPCVFLDDNNHCRVYEVRPKACREYPHTDRKNFHQILGLTLKNTIICPATLEVARRLQQALPR